MAGSTATQPGTGTATRQLSESNFNMLVGRMAAACQHGLKSVGVYAVIILHFNAGWGVPEIARFTTLGENLVTQTIEYWQASGEGNIAAIDSASQRLATSTCG